MTIQTPPNWTQVKDIGWKQQWQHNEYDVNMHVSHQSDHYKEGGEEQAMRWHARVKLGEQMTVGEREFFLCDEMGCEEAEEAAFEWALDWMQSADEWIASLDDAEDWKRASA